MQWSLFYWMDASPAFFHGGYAVALASAVGRLLGWRTRLCAVLTFACAISLITPVPWGTNSADQLVKILSFLFMAVSLCGFTQRAYSLDARADTESSAEPEMIPVWSYRLFQVQLCAVYFFSGLAKAGKWIGKTGRRWTLCFGKPIHGCGWIWAWPITPPSPRCSPPPLCCLSWCSFRYWSGFVPRDCGFGCGRGFTYSSWPP